MTPGYPAATTLGATINSSVTSVTPTSAAGLSAPCYIVIQNEVIYCPTPPVAGAFTGVTRGALGSVAAAHTAFTPLYGLYSNLFPYSNAAEFLDAIAAELATVEARLQTAIGGGTVTSVGLTMPAEFTVGGSPITNAGTFTVTKAPQPSNEFYAGPATGAAAAPTFRALVTADLPAGVGTVTSVGLTMPAEFSVGGSPITGAGTLAVTKANQPANEVYAGPTTGAAAAPAFRALVPADLPVATTGQLGAVEPDGSTITIVAGVISAAPSGGTVTSVALTMPAEFSVGGSPITGAGTLAVTKANQPANEVYAGPTTGAAAAPAFRALVPADLPVATTGQLGAVEPDGTTITIAAGVISAAGGGLTPYGTSVSHPTNQNVASATPTNLTFDTVIRDDIGAYSAGSPTQLTIPAGGAGWYALAATVNVGGGAATYSLAINRNGAGIAFFVVEMTGTFGLSPAGLAYLNVGDVITLTFEQFTGSTANYGPVTLSIVRIN